ncbi:pitrilysin family protein [Streptomyces sp. DH8]|uniref:M16 family metallopeptidase n=1 Tax=Streptomyces sp. DH8 TaxID=2857008 RepID=UPI001E42BB40|nr:insulinase family protein [Streptomyces sp. DH8]
MTQQTDGPAAATTPDGPAAGSVSAAPPAPGFLTETEVDRIPTLLTARSGGGPVAAGLYFRVGAADETLATAGLTHLVEHLALHRHGVSDLHYNGSTAATHTHFVVSGTEEEVVAYLNGVCASLRDLPVERLATEREILRTEQAGRSRGINHQLPLWRYGARGYGLVSYPEYGTLHLTADAVRDWAATWFTRDNAVLWITGDTVPEGLDLTLPAGRRQPLPVPTSALPVTPAYLTGGSGGVVLDGVVRRSVAASLFAEVLGRALFTDLRQKGGYSYAADCGYQPRDNDHATLTAFADALPQKQDAVVGGFIDVLARLRAGTIDRAELDSARAKALKQYERPDIGAAALPSYALNVLTGHPNLSPDEHRAELDAVTVEDLRDVAGELYDSALIQVPGRAVDWAGFTAAPQWSDPVPDPAGTVHRSRERDGVSLAVGPEAVTLVMPAGQITVRYDACAAMRVFPDGARHLIGFDAFVVEVEPTLYAKLTPDRMAVLDAGVPASAAIPMPERDPEEIPRPPVRRGGLKDRTLGMLRSLRPGRG